VTTYHLSLALAHWTSRPELQGKREYLYRNVAADLHWHGRDPGACVQFALDERDLCRAHHDPRHP
jgi:hypothetical protein